MNHESQKSVKPICLRKGINLRFTWMQPTITSRPVHRDGRVFEEKYDGWRIVAYEDGERMQLIRRRGRVQTERFPPRVAEIAGPLSRPPRLGSRLDWACETNTARHSTAASLYRLAFDDVVSDLLKVKAATETTSRPLTRPIRSRTSPQSRSRRATPQNPR